MRPIAITAQGVEAVSEPIVSSPPTICSKETAALFGSQHGKNVGVSKVFQSGSLAMQSGSELPLCLASSSPQCWEDFWESNIF